MLRNACDEEFECARSPALFSTVSRACFQQNIKRNVKLLESAPYKETSRKDKVAERPTSAATPGSNFYGYYYTAPSGGKYKAYLLSGNGLK